MVDPDEVVPDWFETELPSWPLLELLSVELPFLEPEFILERLPDLLRPVLPSLIEPEPVVLPVPTVEPLVPLVPVGVVPFWEEEPLVALPVPLVLELVV